MNEEEKRMEPKNDAEAMYDYLKLKARLEEMDLELFVTRGHVEMGGPDVFSFEVREMKDSYLLFNASSIFALNGFVAGLELGHQKFEERQKRS